ncbi:hypothetical protein ACGIF2_15545 [Cellulomonas sp. P22]|uniref:hypothetical protein n=1 Tax=Cellulomonas sp. P22 TaxID=3373189 RepID=UPI0037BCDA82
MTTLTPSPLFASRDRRRPTAFDRLRYTPAPAWERGNRARHVRYVAASMVGWMVVGLACNALVAALLSLAG